MPNITENIITAIDYMEEHLFDGPDLGTVADAVHYSKYHLHRMFVNEVGIMLHDYKQRRQLTEAAFIQKIAADTGYRELFKLPVGLGTMLAAGGSAIIARKWERERESAPRGISLF